MEAIAAVTVFALMILLVDRTFRDLAREAREKIGGEMAAWHEALVGVRQSRFAHDLVSEIRRPMKEAADWLLSVSARELADGVRGRLKQCEELSSKFSPESGSAESRWPDAGSAGFLGGYAAHAPSRSGNPLRLFSANVNPVGWLPRSFSEELARALRPIDVVRLLHTPELERRSIITMLRLRLLFLCVAPLLGSLTWGLAPLSETSSTTTDFIFLLVLGESLITALLAAPIASWVMGKSVRWPFFLLEQTLTMALLWAFPSWVCFAYAAGPVVWLEKRDWRLDKLLIWLVITLAAMVCSLWSEPPLSVMATLLLSVLVLGLIADSYGLMLPAVASTAWSGWRGSREVRQEAGDGELRLRAAMADGLAYARFAVEQAATGDSLSQAELLRSIARAEARIATGGGKQGRGKSLEIVCSEAISLAGIPPAEWNSGADVQATQIQADPKELGALKLSSRHRARKIRQLLAGFAREAVAHGQGLLETRIGQDGAEVTVRLANEIHPEQLSGRSTGTRRLKNQASSIEGVSVNIDGAAEFDGMPMWVVTVRLSPDCFRLG
jgi:hypothetical protein